MYSPTAFPTGLREIQPLFNVRGNEYWVQRFSDLSLQDHWQMVPLLNFWQLDINDWGSVPGEAVDRLQITTPQIIAEMQATDHWDGFRVVCAKVGIHPVTAIVLQQILVPLNNNEWAVPANFPRLHKYLHVCAPTINDWIYQVRRIYRNDRDLDRAVRKWANPLWIRDFLKWNALGGSYGGRPMARINKNRKAALQEFSTLMMGFAEEVVKGLKGKYLPATDFPQNYDTRHIEKGKTTVAGYKRVDGLCAGMFKALGENSADHDYKSLLLEAVKKAPEHIAQAISNWYPKTSVALREMWEKYTTSTRNANGVFIDLVPPLIRQDFQRWLATPTLDNMRLWEINEWRLGDV